MRCKNSSFFLIWLTLLIKREQPTVETCTCLTSSIISFVFDEYTWNYDLSQPYTDYQGKLIPSRIPYTAFISGPTVGGSFGKGDKAPRAVTKLHYQKLCPKPLTMKSNHVNDKLDPYADASVMMKAWAEKLRQTRAKCIEVGPSNQIFSYMVFGDGRRVQPFFDEFVNSPILKRFTWSSLVNDAVSTNIHLFSDAPKAEDRPLSSIRLLQEDDDIEDATNPIPGLLAIHVRRGDFLDHCRNLASWEAEYMGWLRIPLLVDRFKKPVRTGSEDNEAIMNHYLKHCWPTIEEIVQKIDAVRQTSDGRGLTRVYIMTNGPTDWIEDLKNNIMDMGGWEGVASSRDLTLVPEQKYIAQAVDMAIAMRSQMYIGNGFSSLSANVVILRLSRKFPALANRLW
ncbi:uncharacterized protein FOMMEDRAFT_81968 [Fomitiporia mediterranea MF3/22]|uniref:uncharacterized protein n=1 Tax=Fomitiporia mediterranea (strain MF3/22) TaxID=694068 RepID=UPI0004408442|nr:uncharacterized protein FOMMEDRAFT_81968 [Fomitiporia mediterranea MF3/22]EJD03536.1 hypothetical protein FOMMEDRAFT_81968 [Fomitiporia mediterranea MF3/22]